MFFLRMHSSYAGSTSLLQKIVESKKEFKNIPVIAGADFGHAMPLFIFQIGGEVEIEANQSKVTTNQLCMIAHT